MSNNSKKKEWKAIVALLCFFAVFAAFYAFRKSRHVPEILKNAPQQRAEIIKTLSIPAIDSNQISQEQILDEFARIHKTTTRAVEKLLQKSSQHSSPAIRSQAYLLRGDLFAASQNAREALSIGADSQTKIIAYEVIAQISEETHDSVNALDAYKNINALNTHEHDAIAAANTLTAEAHHLILLANYKDAIPLLDRSISLLESKLSDDHVSLLKPLLEKSKACRQIDQIKDAKTMIHRAEKILLAHTEADPRLSADCFIEMALILEYEGKFSQSDELILKALTDMRVKLGPYSPQYARLLSIRSTILQARENIQEALKLCNESLNIYQKIYGNEHMAVAHQLEQLASLLLWDNHYDEALEKCREGLAICEKFGADDHQTIDFQITIAQILLLQGNLAEAKKLHTTSINKIESHLGRDSSKLILPLNDMAHLYKDEGDLLQSSVAYLRALQIFETKKGPEHPHMSVRLSNYAQVLASREKLEEAIPLMRRAIALGEKQLEHDSLYLASYYANLSIMLRRIGNQAEAIDLVKRAISIREKNSSEGGETLGTYLSNLSLLLLDTNQDDEAEKVSWRALELTEKDKGANHTTVAIRLNNLALVLKKQKKYSEAIPLFLRAIRIDEEFYGKNHLNLASYLNNLADAYTQLGDHENAAALLQRQLYIAFLHRKKNGSPFEHEQAAIMAFMRNQKTLGKTEEEIDLQIRQLIQETSKSE